jgi:flagellar protein FliO/FliZ
MKLFSFKKSTIFFIFSVLMLSLSLSLYAQKSNADESTGGAVTAVTDETAILLDAGTAGIPGVKPAKAPSSIWILLRVVIVLAIVCAAIYGVVWLLKKTTVVNAANDPYLKSVSSITVAPNKTIQVVTIGGKGYLVGVSDQSINLIDEIEDRELIDAMNLEADRKASAPPASFASVISSFLPTGKNHDASAEKTEALAPETSSIGAEMIRRQRERLSGGSLGDESGTGETESPRNGGQA